MNKYIKYGLIFIAGLGIGYSVSYVIEKERFEKRLNEELEKNQDYMIKLLGYQKPGDKEVPKELQNESASEEEIINEPDNPHVLKRFTKSEEMNARKDEFLRNHSRVAYDKIPDPYPAEEEVDEVALEVNNDNPDRDISIITADQFAREHLAFEKEVLNWWPQNKLLTTEDGDILDVPDLIGTEWMDRIGEFVPDEVFVRNYTAETDYNIVQQHGDYYDFNE